MKKVILFMRLLLLVCFLTFLDKECYSQTPARTKAINTIVDSLPDNNTKAITPARLRFTLFRMLDATKDSVPILDMINLQKNIPSGLAGLDGAGKILTSQLPNETDPTVPSWVKAITETDTTNWNTAFSWGDHSTAGYLVPILSSPTEGQVLKYISGAWRNSSASNTPDSTTANNGLNLSNKDVRLGGPLLSDTYVGDGSFRLGLNVERLYLQGNDTVRLFNNVSDGGFEANNSGAHITGYLKVWDDMEVAGRLNLENSLYALRIPKKSSDPLGTNGDIYYNTATNKFRKYENSSWQDFASIGDAAADGVTKGVATFNSNDFNSSGGVIALDYNNMQVGNASQNGILTPTIYDELNQLANSGITKTGQTMQLGGEILQATSITSTVGTRTLVFSGVTGFADGPFGFTRIVNNGTGTALNVGNTSSGIGLVVSATGTALLASGSTAGQFSGQITVSDQQENPVLRAAVAITRTNTANNDVHPLVDIIRRTSDVGGGTVGLGSAIRFIAQVNSSNEGEQARVYSTWIDATDGSTDGAFGIATTVAGSSTEKLYINNVGQVRLNLYTDAGSFVSSDTTNNKPLAVDASGNIYRMGSWAGGGGGSSYTFTNGLTESAGTAKLGGAITENTTLTASNTTHRVNITGINTGQPGMLNVSTTGNSGVGITGTATTGWGIHGVASGASGRGVMATAFDGIGVYSSATGIAFKGEAVTNTALELSATYGATDALGVVNSFTVQTTGTAANGIGGKEELLVEMSNGSLDTAARVSWEWSNATAGSQTGALKFWTKNNAGNLSNKLQIDGDGGISALAFGTGTQTGTAAYNLAVTSTGKLIEVATSSTPGIDDVLAVGQEITTDRIIQLRDNRITWQDRGGGEYLGIDSTTQFIGDWDGTGGIGMALEIFRAGRIIQMGDVGGVLNGTMLYVNDPGEEVGIQGSGGSAALFNTGTGNVRFSQYGDGTKTGTLSNLAGFDTDGDILDVSVATVLSPLTANGGITRTSDNFHLGGTLAAGTTTLTASAGADKLLIAGVGGIGTPVFHVTATGNFSYAARIENTQGYGLYVTSTDRTGIIANGDIGIEASGNTGGVGGSFAGLDTTTLPLRIDLTKSNSGNGSRVYTGLQFLRNITNPETSYGSGLGSSITWVMPYFNTLGESVGFRNHSEQEVVATDLNGADASTEFRFKTLVDSTLTQVLTLGKDNYFNHYGTGTHTGTVAYDLSVASDGKIIESAVDGFAQYATATIAATTTETTLLSTGKGSLTITPAKWVQGKTYKVIIKGVISTDGSSPGQPNVRVKLGSTTIATTGNIFTGTGVTNRAWEIEVYLTARTVSSTGTVMTMGMWQDDNDGATKCDNGTTTSTIDMTTNQTLDVTCQWSNSSAGNSISAYIITLEPVNR